MNSDMNSTNNPSSGGYLSGFIESSAEMPDEGLDGDCVVHSSGQHDNDKMKVRLSNGMKEGTGIIMRDGAPFIQIEYHYDAPNGSVCRMDDCGNVEMQGQLMNGVERGLFEEYDNTKKVVWRGYYRNGERYSEVVESAELEGYYDERDVATGSLLSTAQYDDLNQDKNGHCFEYENNQIKNECMYENGVKIHIIREFVDGKMVVYDTSGVKIYEGIYYGDMKNGFLCHEPMEGMTGFFKELDSNHQLISVSQYDELNVSRNGRCFELENGKVKRVCLYEMNQLIQLILEFDGSMMTEYDPNGKKIYEGAFSGDMQCGFVRNGRGYEMDENEMMKRACLYENGEMKRVIQEFDGKRMTEFDENGKQVYRGGFARDRKHEFKRNGRGYCFDENEAVKQYCEFENGVVKKVIQSFNGSTMIEFNRNGRMKYEGEWKGDLTNGFVGEGKGKGYDLDGKSVVYTGEWKDGTKEGFGTEFDNGHVVYSGEWKRGIREGKGTEYRNGQAVYTGEWSYGVREGIGEEWDENGMSLVGNWKNGIIQDGVVYERDGSQEIQRACVYQNGKMKRVVQEFCDTIMIEYDENGILAYMGEWKGNMKNGLVRKEKWKEYGLDGETVLYSGEWVNGKRIGFVREGKGKEYGLDGETILYSGEWVNGKRNGCGEAYENGLVVYSGEWKEGKREGKGMEYENGCAVYSGEWKNGEREGEGMEYANGLVVYGGEWKNGLRNGDGYCMNENGRVVFVGEWESGRGRGKEMDESGNVVYEGEWGERGRNGMGEEMNRGGMEMNGGGLGKEMSGGGMGEEMSRMGAIGQWKDGKKDGLVYERDESRRIRCGYLYENGEMKQAIEEWELYNVILSRRIDYSVMHRLDPSNLFAVDLSTGHTVGGFQLNGKWFSVDWSMDTSQGVMVDMDSKETIVYVNSERMDTQCSVGIVDLDTNGRRWEGSVKDGKPYGIGVIYDEEGNVAYEGFMMNGMKVCYGIEYYSDIGRVEYEGCFYNDTRFGKGTLYDRYGVVDYEGLWKNNEPCQPPFDGRIVDDRTESMDIPNNSFNESKSFLLHSILHSLKRIEIGDDCFGSVRIFELDGLSKLVSIVIGARSFTIGKDWDTIKTSERTDCSCRIVNCPILKSIQIGDYSFGDYRSFEVKNLPALQSIMIGNNCYDFASFILADLPQLYSVQLAANAFSLCSSIVLENLPRVQSIELGPGALEGNAGDGRETISDKPYNFKNTLTMRNLPSLTSFKGDDYNITCIGSVILENIPQLASSGIQFRDNCFSYVYSIQSSSTLSLTSSLFDAPGLEQYLSFGYNAPSTTSHVVKKRNELDSIPSDVEDLWIGRFDTTGVTDFSFNVFQSLRSLVIGNAVFWGVTSFELKHLPSLQSIVIGNFCFFWTSSFSLTDLPQLQSIKLAFAAFRYVHSVAFENLPKLQSIELGTYALCGDDGDDRKTINDYPYKYKNTLTMRNLPSLYIFMTNEGACGAIGSVILENIRRLSYQRIRFGRISFYYTHSIHSSFDATVLECAIRRASKSF